MDMQLYSRFSSILASEGIRVNLAERLTWKVALAWIHADTETPDDPGFALLQLALNDLETRMPTESSLPSVSSGCLYQLEVLLSLDPAAQSAGSAELHYILAELQSRQAPPRRDAVPFYKRAYQLCLSDSPLFPLICSHLAIALMERYYSGLGSLEDVPIAARLFDDASDAFIESEDKTDRERGAFYIACQAGALATLFTQQRRLDDLDNAIDLLRGVLYTFSGVAEGLAKIDVRMHETLGWKTAAISISACLHRRFLYQGNHEDALEVYGHLREQTIAKEWSQRRLCQIYIALYKSICFIHNPQPRHIDDSVSLLNDQVLLSDPIAQAWLFYGSSQDDIPDQWTRRLNYGSSSDSSPGVAQAFAFHALGEILQRRFSYFRIPRDAEWCLETVREAAKLYGQDHRSTELPVIRALVCADQYDSSGNVEDIDKAIEACREALALCRTVGRVDEWSPVFHLGIMLQLRFYHFSFVDDSDEDISRGTIPLLKESHQLLQCALDTLPKAYAYKEKSSNILRYLGRSYFYEFMLNGEDSLACKSFQSYRLALETVPPDSSYRHIYLTELSDTIFQCYLQSPLPVDINDLDFAMNGPHDAVVEQNGPYASQLKAAAQWGFNLLRFGLKLHDFQDGQQGMQSSVLPLPAQLYDRAIVAYGHMMELIKKLFIGHSILTRLGYMRTTSQHVRVAAYITALFCDNPDLALEWLEQGRLVVWRQQQNVRASMLAESDVDDYDPEFAENLKDHAQFLEKAHSIPVDGSEPMKEAGERYLDGTPHHRLTAEYWECDIQKLRLQIPGYENFLQPKQLADLRQALSHTSIGSIVTLVATESPEMLHMKTLALILQPGEDHVRSVKLELENHEVEELCEMMDGILSNPTLRSRGSSRIFFESSSGAPSSVRRVLSRLWYGVVKPVLQALSLLVPNQPGAHPRIMWCPTGSFSFLPIHAAGDFSVAEPGHRTTDFVVSSYTSSISALLSSLQRGPVPDFHHLLAICVSDPPEQSSIPLTRIEMDRIEAQIGTSAMIKLEDENAKEEFITEGMKICSWIHLACHGVQNRKDPLKSAFSLSDGRLELADLIRMTDAVPDFAFLSACQTSTGDAELPDEATHLAAGVQLIGYRSVIATMWSIDDQDGPSVADGVYSRLFAGGRPDSSQAAHALHHAILDLQERAKDAASEEEWFMRWVPFIHIGL